MFCIRGARVKKWHRGQHFCFGGGANNIITYNIILSSQWPKICNSNLGVFIKLYIICILQYDYTNNIMSLRRRSCPMVLDLKRSNSYGYTIGRHIICRQGPGQLATFKLFLLV